MQVGARYYDPATGSFLTRDIDLSQLAYVYCGDDPINYLDPTGHFKASLKLRQWSKFIGGVMVGVATFVDMPPRVAAVVGVTGTILYLYGDDPETIDSIITWFQNHPWMPNPPPGAGPPSIY